MTYSILTASDVSTWAIQLSGDVRHLTLAGWWAVLVSNVIFSFLMLRWLWRHVVWALLLRDLARLELRLVASHPDGYGGLAFIGQYPNAYSTFVFAVSCVLGSAIAKGLQVGDVTPATYGSVMGGWLLIVLILFAYPLLAFRKPLMELKEHTFLASSALATQHHRAVERDVFGTNISAPEDAELMTTQEVPDPSKVYAAAQKLSAYLISRSALLPLSAAALLPLVAAGAIQLPIKELLKVMKRLLIL